MVYLRDMWQQVGHRGWKNHFFQDDFTPMPVPWQKQLEDWPLLGSSSSQCSVRTSLHGFTSRVVRLLTQKLRALRIRKKKTLSTTFSTGTASLPRHSILQSSSGWPVTPGMGRLTPPLDGKIVKGYAAISDLL